MAKPRIKVVYIVDYEDTVEDKTNKAYHSFKDAARAIGLDDPNVYTPPELRRATEALEAYFLRFMEEAGMVKFEYSKSYADMHYPKGVCEHLVDDSYPLSPRCILCGKEFKND